MTRFAAPIAEAIWDMKYRFKDEAGRPLDVTVEDTWRRIARALSAAEKSAAGVCLNQAARLSSIRRVAQSERALGC